AGLRAEASVEAALEVARGLAVVLALSAGTELLADDRPTLPAWVPDDAEGASRFALPPAPAHRFRTGLGLAWSPR
ncbi:MAG TPA: hypothetical protein VGD74_06075, partial [Vulgatibacter sp.]